MPGTIEKRGNSHRLIVPMGSDLNGKPIILKKTVKGLTDAQAKKELSKFYAACVDGNVNATNKLTVESFSEKWISEYAEVKLKKSTISNYKKAIKNYIVPEMGNAKLTKVRLFDVQQWVNRLSGKLSPKTVRNAFFVLSKMYDSAVKWQIITANPCANIDLPALDKKESNYYNREETALLFEKLLSVDDNHYKYLVAIMLTIFTGLRRSELAGLMWSDIDLEKCSITVSRVRMYEKNYGAYEDSPKSHKSARRVSVPEEVRDMLRELKKRQMEERLLIGSKWGGAPYIMLNDMGDPLPNDSPSKWFANFLKKEGLRKITFHQLRHTHATMLHYLGVDMLNISRRLGHAQPSTTTNIYTHIFADVDTEISSKISTEFFPNLSQNSKLIRKKP